MAACQPPQFHCHPSREPNSGRKSGGLRVGRIPGFESCKMSDCGMASGGSMKILVTVVRLYWTRVRSALSHMLIGFGPS